MAARLESYSFQYEALDTLSKKTTRTVSDINYNIANTAASTNGEDAARTIDNFFRAFLAMSTDTYSGGNLTGKGNIINLIGE